MFFSISFIWLGTVLYNSHVHSIFLTKDLCYRNLHGHPNSFLYYTCKFLHSAPDFYFNTAHHFTYLYQDTCCTFKSLKIYLLELRLSTPLTIRIIPNDFYTYQTSYCSETQTWKLPGLGANWRPTFYSYMWPESVTHILLSLQNLRHTFNY